MCRIECGHPGIFPVLTWCQRVFQMWSKLCRILRAQIESVRCDTVLPKSAEIHDTCIRPRECVCGSTCNHGSTRAPRNQFSVQHSQQQQPEGWRFVPDTILPGYRRAPQWVPAKTPTVHLGPDQREGRGWPIKIRQHSKQCRNTPNMVAEQCRSRARAPMTSAAEVLQDYCTCAHMTERNAGTLTC